MATSRVVCGVVSGATNRLKLPVHVPAVSAWELTGTSALTRGIPPGAPGGIQILGMVLLSLVETRDQVTTGNADLKLTEDALAEDTAALVPSRAVSLKGVANKTELAKLSCEYSVAVMDG